MIRLPASRSSAALLLGLVLATATRAAAQDAAALDSRMREFARTLSDTDSLASFFPRRGDWSWVTTLRRRGAADRRGAWRFPAGDTRRALSRQGPLCPTFEGPGDIAPAGQLGRMQFEDLGPWRRVRGTRFVPPGASSRSPVYVEWRREDGTWVVSALGDVEAYNDSPPTTEDPLSVRRGGDSTQAYAPSTRWYADNEPIVYRGRRYVKNGIPMKIEPRLLARVGSLDGVSVYVEAGQPPAGVLYVATGPGEYFPYMYFGSSCGWSGDL